jgi:hypothetical protein
MNLLTDNLEKIIAISLLFGSGLLFRFILQAFGQTWIKTKSHTATLILLPIITYVITNVISGNIALSLGMVGALSIVRFRNPVRSPLELSTYFAAITMGISASVSLNWLLFLILSILAVIMALSAINFVGIKLFKKPLFIISFSEGNNLCTLIIDASETIDLCEKSDLLQSKVASKDKSTYSLASDNFYKLKQLEDNHEIQKRSNSIQLSR